MNTNTDSQTETLSAPDRSDLDIFCTVASEIDISGLLPEDLSGLRPALYEYRRVQHRRPLAEIAKRVANEVKRTMPDDGRHDHKRVIGWFVGVASRTLRRGGGVSVAGTTRNPGKLHSDRSRSEDDATYPEIERDRERLKQWYEQHRAQGAGG